MKLDAKLAWWAQRPPREKLLIVGSLALGLAALGDALITAPLEKKIKRSTAEAVAMREKLATLRAAEGGDGVSQPSLREREAQLRLHLQAAQQRSAAQQLRLAEAARLPETLRAIVTTVGSARLLELDLTSDVETASQASAGADLRRVYRLPITLKVSGSWSELNSLLTQIERHAQAMQWSVLTLDNTEWPAIQLTLKAHVLSHAPRWGASS